MEHEKLIISIYYLCDETAKSLGIKDKLRAKNTIAEIATIALASTLYFHGNHYFARLQLHQLGYFSKVVSPSRFNRRLHKIPEIFWQQLFKVVFIINQKENSSHTYIVDSFPIHTAQIHKFFRVKCFSGKKYHGYIASKKQFFCGLKVHMLTSLKGSPVQFLVLPGSVSDLKGLFEMEFELPRGSLILGDKAYASKEVEKYLSEVEGVYLITQKKKNHKKQYAPIVSTVISSMRNQIETTFSKIKRLMPPSIIARTAKGFLLKLEHFILSMSLKDLLTG